MAVSGQAEMRALGPAKIFYPAHRLPLADLMSLSSDLILILDDELFVLNANDTLLYHFGLEASELKGLRIDRSPLAPYFTAARTGQLLQTVEGVEHAFDCEIERGGATRYYRGKALPVVFEAGARGVGIILEDMTADRRHQQELEARVRERTCELELANRALEVEVEERRRTEERLAASQRTVEQILETTPNLVYVYDMEPVQLRYANPNLTTILGYPSEQSWDGVGLDILPLVHPDDLPAFTAHREALDASADGEVRESEVRVLHARGHYVLFRCRELVFERDSAGRARLIIGTAEDVTERRRAANALRTANEQLLLLNSITRHDILNQLNVLAGWHGMLEGCIEDPEVAEYLGRAKQAVETVRRQITFTRDYQSIGAHPPEWQCVQAVIDRVLEGLDREGMAVETRDCDVEVYADRLLEKAVYALIDNAIRHSETARTISFCCVPIDDGLTIVCRDDGIGIPESEKDRIFDRAFGRNSGYGLFLAREIVGITGLSIRESGTAGEGACFEIRVPHGLFRPALRP